MTFVMALLMLAHVISYGVVIYGAWRALRSATDCKVILTFDKSPDSTMRGAVK